MESTRMTDLLSIFTFKNIESLRKLCLACDSSNDQHLVDGVYLSWDDAETRVTMHIESEPGSLINMNAEVSGAPRWMSLNFALGVGPMVQGDTLCVVLDASADSESLLSIFVRSRFADRVEDFDWDESIRLTHRRQITTAFCKVPAAEATAEECYRTLVIRLPRESFRIYFHDLRFFTIRSEQYALASNMTLGSEA
jgi:hypothetical protein